MVFDEFEWADNENDEARAEAAEQRAVESGDKLIWDY